MSNEQTYNVIFAGAIKEGFDAIDVQNVFVEKLRLSTDKVPAYFSGKRVVLKKSLSMNKAELMKKKFLAIGAETIIVPNIDEIDTLNAKTKNQVFNKNQTKENKLSAPHKSIDKDALRADKIEHALVNDTLNDDVLSEQALKKKVALAQSMMMEEQLKSQIKNNQNDSSYKKLTFFSIFLAIVIFLLYFYSKGGV